ncbi:DUF503 domain-containing protein [Clostridium rectalis]|uniref:DUF503 domain-containing protein n=1 Tax=Clostridium rectalis TaxID=2040295 RepID=UPI000F6372B8|nr:DUF503 domain-containing protein [Clostridium rectalis]
MIIGSARMYLQVPWVHSLKEKRMILQSIIKRVRNKFNVSIAEIDYQDIHQSIGLGIACVCNEAKYANTIIQNVVAFIENNTEALVEDVEIEIL